MPWGEEERTRQEQIKRAHLSLDKLFGKPCSSYGYTPIDDQNIDFMRKSIVELVYRRIYSASYIFPGGTKVKLTNKGGTIKIERSETNKQIDEVEERIID